MPPPTQIVPSSSRETCTRPRRPSAVPWLATYGVCARPLSQQPCGQRRVEAAGDRILDGRAVLREERADLERLGRAGRVGADDAEVEIDRSRRDRRARRWRRASSTATQPGPLSAHWASTISSRVDPEHLGDVLDQRLVDGPFADQRRRCEREVARRRARIRTRPAPHSCTISLASRRGLPAPARRGRCRASDGRRTAALRDGVKIRTR